MAIDMTQTRSCRSCPRIACSRRLEAWTCAELRHAGRAAVRAAYEGVWATFPDAQWNDARHFVHGDRGVSEWTFIGTAKDGTRVEVNGCDVFTFRGGRIAIKNSYRKTRVPAGP